MMDWLEFKLQGLKVQELQTTKEKPKVLEKGKAAEPKERPKTKKP